MPAIFTWIMRPAGSAAQVPRRWMPPRASGMPRPAGRGS